MKSSNHDSEVKDEFKKYSSRLNSLTYQPGNELDHELKIGGKLLGKFIDVYFFPDFIYRANHVFVNLEHLNF